MPCEKTPAHCRVALINAAQKNNIDIISIDHHKNDNTDIFKAYIIDIDAPATGFLVWKLLKDLKIEKPWDIKISNALYAALMTDTGSFRHANTTSKVHRTVAELIDLGANINQVSRSIYDTNTINRLKFIGFSKYKDSI